MQFTHKVKVAIVASVATLAIAGAAFAYFTTTGSGTGSGTTGTATAMALHGVVTDTMYPGTESEVTFTIDNDSPGHQLLNTITLTNVTTDVGHATCIVADFTMDPVVANEDIPSGDANDVVATGTLKMANTGISQDGCKGAPLTLNLTSN